MNHPAEPEKSSRPLSNNRIIGLIMVVVLGMFGLGFAVVPLYNAFCEVTGLNGKVKAEAVSESKRTVDDTREVTIEFVTSVGKDVPMDFRVETAKMKIHPGRYYTVKFHAENLTEQAIMARAIPSIAPGPATQYLEKVECFCFSEQKFEPREHRVLPVRFTINPGLPGDIRDVTLSYTFFDITDKQQNTLTR